MTFDNANKTRGRERPRLNDTPDLCIVANYLSHKSYLRLDLRLIPDEVDFATRGDWNSADSMRCDRAIVYAELEGVKP